MLSRWTPALEPIQKSALLNGSALRCLATFRKVKPLAWASLLQLLASFFEQNHVSNSWSRTGGIHHLLTPNIPLSQVNITWPRKVTVVTGREIISDHSSAGNSEPSGQKGYFSDPTKSLRFASLRFTEVHHISKLRSKINYSERTRNLIVRFSIR